MSRSKNGVKAERTWRGRSAGERRAERKQRLIEAGIELFGTRGYSRSPVKAVCEQAGLTERYFYETFTDREHLLSTIYDGLVEETQARTLTAIAAAPDDLYGRLAVGLEAFFLALTTDPRRARIQEIETVGVSPAMETSRRASLHSYAAILADQIRQSPGWRDDGKLRLDIITLGLVGAINEQMIDFVLGELAVTAEELLEQQKLLLTATVRALLEG